MDVKSANTRRLIIQGKGLPGTGLTKSTMREFTCRSNINRRNELPNKYNVKDANLNDLEAVISQKVYDKYGTQPKSKTMKALETHIAAEGKLQNTEPRPFYYTDRNEIMSMQEFFQVYKQKQIQRSLVEKQNLKERIEVTRKKINEISKQVRESSRSTSPRRSNIMSPRNSLFAVTKSFLSLKNVRPATSGGVARTPSNFSPCYTEQLPVPADSSSNAAQKFQKAAGKLARPQTANSRPGLTLSTSVGQSIDNDQELLTDPDREDSRRFLTVPDAKTGGNAPGQLLLTPTDVGMPTDLAASTTTNIPDSNLRKNLSPIIVSDGQDISSTTHLQTRPLTARTDNTYRTKKLKVLNKEPNLTTKEIYRHLAYLTVTPQKSKKDENCSLVEQFYVGMFRDAKELDRSVEKRLKSTEPPASGQNLQQLLGRDSIPTSAISNRLLRPATAHSNYGLTVNTEGLSPRGGFAVGSPHTTTRLEDELNNKRIKTNINRNVGNIEKMLKDNDTRRPESATSKLTNTLAKEPVKKFNRQLSNRIPLRHQVAKKYDMSTLLKRNRDLSQRMKSAKFSASSSKLPNPHQVAYDNTQYTHYYHL